MSDKTNKQLKDTEISTSLHKLCDEWKVFVWGLFRPLVIIPLIVTVISLYFANMYDMDRRFSLILQIIAALIVAIAGGFFYDVVRNIFKSDILVKKGLSAVRNLSLARLKTKNISDRAKTSASSEEIRNLLSLLEKDIANATQEWNDILPGVSKIEEVYVLLADKESELDITKKEKEQLDKKLTEEKQLNEKEKEDLKIKLDEKERKISELSHQVNKIRNTIRLKADSLLQMLDLEEIGSSPIAEVVFSNSKTCTKCGRGYVSSDPNSQFCGYCSK